MNTHADKTQEKKSQSVTVSSPEMQSSTESAFQFDDNRSEVIAQRKLQEMAINSPHVKQLRAFQEMANNSPQAKQAAQLQSMADNHTTQQEQHIQRKENNTGLPDSLKAGMENWSGISLDDVKVHRNSDKPAQLQAHAFAQGTDIHLGPGQEKYLPHEAWHVEQQKQGRVKPTLQMKGKVNIYDDAGLEMEANVKGGKAINIHQMQNINLKNACIEHSPLQARWVNTGGPNLLWEKPLDGVQWYYITEGKDTGKMFYRIVNKKAIPKPLRKKYTSNANTPMSREDFVSFSESGDKYAVEDPSIITEDEHIRELLTNSMKGHFEAENLAAMDLHDLEVEHAKYIYSQGTLIRKQSMKKFPIDKTTLGKTTQIDEMRKKRVTDPSLENCSEYSIKTKAKTEKNLIENLMPKLDQLTQYIRLTHYYDEASDASIKDTGLLQSKIRRILKAGGEEVTNKSGKLDDELGNTDHVFFFAEYEGENRHAPFRKTRFGGDAKTGDAILHQKERLDGSERRVSFPLREIRQEGVHGYLVDLNSMPGINPVEHVFSGAPMHKMQAEKNPPSGTHLLMDLLRQRFKQSNFPGNKNDNEMIEDLMTLNMEQLYTFLFRKHPKLNKPGANEVNPQILVPGSVPLNPQVARFDEPEIDKEGAKGVKELK